jgi:hypothetical protein
MTDEDNAFIDVPNERFPIVIEMFRVDTGEVVWSQFISGPGAVTIPPLKDMQGVAIGTRVIDGTGLVEEIIP